MQVQVIFSYVFQEIVQKVQAFVTAIPNSAQACVLCLLSHGDAGQLYGTDGNALPVDSLVTFLSERMAPSLAGKPKLVILQACRGSEMDLFMYMLIQFKV